MKIESFAVEEWLTRYEQQAEINLAETSVSALSLQELLDLTASGEEFMQQLLATRLSYGQIPGSLRLRKAVAATYQTVSAEQVTITHGTIGANHLVHLSLVNPEDHVITFAPSYQQHQALAESIGAQVTVLTLKEQNRFLPDPADIQAAIRPNTKLICLTNPNNPSCTLMGRQLLQEVCEQARQVGAYILSDEVYRGAEADGVEAAPAIVDLYEKGISTGGVSKALSLPGLRLGWIAAPQKLLADINKQRDYSIISVGAIDDLLAALALENREILLERSRRILSGNREIIQAWLAQEDRVSWCAPDAGSSALLKIPSQLPDQDFALGLLKTRGVLLVPGSCFDIPGYYRLGYTSSQETLRRGLAEISAYLTELEN
ncbi:MAG: aminotransferase class I/II-fold pyridoxal phosphate-dependent enzyme [Rothia sp. (in: high G+C Gram-positive bacteria)]|nr:aminotransferase class I/II-fold pyridoxal phosphate-dependent enzyme [Rothia sp. (in: high G+C Gram-positive bacteria)]